MVVFHDVVTDTEIDFLVHGATKKVCSCIYLLITENTRGKYYISFCSLEEQVSMEVQMKMEKQKIL